MVFLPSKKELWGKKVIKIKTKVNKNKKAIVLRNGEKTSYFNYSVQSLMTRTKWCIPQNILFGRKQALSCQKSAHILT